MSDPFDIFGDVRPAPETVVHPPAAEAAEPPPGLVFDIETGPLPDDELKAVLPVFDAASLGPDPGEFDPATVKYGNTKDEAKRAEKLQAAKLAHEKAVSDWRAKANRAAHDWRRQCVDLAPLSPITGRVLAIGYCRSDAIEIEAGRSDERVVIEDFWDSVERAKSSGAKAIGFNILGFDVPFLIRRSWRLGVSLPSFLNPREPWRCGVFVDLLDVWKCGSRFSPPKHVNDRLDTVARYFGLGGKTDGVTGADFHRLWSGTPEERKQAVAYLTRDVELTYAVALKMGVVR